MDAPTYLAHASTRHTRVSAQKCRLVADLVRERFVGEALTILHFNAKKKASQIVEKTLRSAIANAQQKQPDVDVDTLVVAKIHVDEGPSWKRIRPAPMGRAFRLLKRTSHVHVFLDEKKGR
jgi:large subunit ribosomal protein L22